MSVSPKLLRVFFKGIEKRIKVFDETPETKILEMIKRLFQICEDDSRIFFQDEDGDILILPSPIIDGLCVHLYIEPSMIPTPSIQQSVSDNLLPGFKWIPVHQEENGPSVITNNGYTLGNIRTFTGKTSVVSSTEYTKGEIFTKFTFKKTFYQIIGIVPSDRLKVGVSVPQSNKKLSVFDTENFFKTWAKFVTGAMYVNFDERYVIFFWINDGDIIRRVKRPIPEGPVRFYAYSKEYGITIDEGGSSEIPRYVGQPIEFDK